MPHKRNPILTENVCGLARLVRGYALAALENMALWHERDISHSSVERVIAPDATIALDFMLARLAGVVEGLEVRPDACAQNLERARRRDLLRAGAARARPQGRARATRRIAGCSATRSPAATSRRGSRDDPDVAPRISTRTSSRASLTSRITCGISTALFARALEDE